MASNYTFMFFVFGIILYSVSLSYERHRLKYKGLSQICAIDYDCFDYETCKDGMCVNACTNSTCGHDAWCKARYHDAVCVCRPGFVGDPLTKCVRRSCTDDSDCYYFEKCEDMICINVCGDSACGMNAKCDVKHHVALCSCSRGLTGNPHHECLPKRCETIDDCHDNEHCLNNVCSEACAVTACGINARCSVENHIASCVCIANYIGDPYAECSRPKCTVNGDCYKFEKCENNECIASCKPNMCGENAWCNIENHIALCACLPGLIGDPQIKCVVKECNTGEDCLSFEKCSNKKCILACEDVICGPGMWCRSINHLSVCVCMDKYSGDAETGCVRDNCTANTDCFQSEICVSSTCISACDFISCEETAWCIVKDHVASCTCPRQLSGDPLSGCVAELEESYWGTIRGLPG